MSGCFSILSSCWRVKIARRVGGSQRSWACVTIRIACGCKTRNALGTSGPRDRVLFVVRVARGAAAVMGTHARTVTTRMENTFLDSTSGYQWRNRPIRQRKCCMRVCSRWKICSQRCRSVIRHAVCGRAGTAFSLGFLLVLGEERQNRRTKYA